MGRKPKAADSANTMGTNASKSERKAMEAVAKHMRYNVATKTAVIKGQKVEYFSGVKAVDCLMKSKWVTDTQNADSDVPYFMNRTYAVDYCNKLLREDFFVRAEKLELKHVDSASSPDSGNPVSTAGGPGKDGGKVSIRKRGEKATDSPRPKKQGENGGSEKKAKRKFRLDVHRQQVFFDSKDDVYFWKYDPPSYTSYLLGLAVVIGAIAMTLQPLWPDSSRETLWYLSVGVFIIMGVLVCVIVARWLVYGVVLVATNFKLKLWILPNLEDEKSGFFASFKPLYSVEWAKKKKRKKHPDSSVIDEIDSTGENTEMEAENGRMENENENISDGATENENGVENGDNDSEPPNNS